MRLAVALTVASGLAAGGACTLSSSGIPGEQSAAASGGAPSVGSGGQGGQLFGGGGLGTSCEPGTDKACYSGPDGTLGLGICSAGTQQCAPNGQGYGACIGAVLPKTEACGTPEDESCDGAASCTGEPGFAIGATGRGQSSGQSIAVDRLGNVVVAGSFTGSIDLGDGKPKDSVGAHDLFVAKLDPNGVVVWARTYGDDAEQTDVHVAVDTYGDVLLAGRFTGTVTFGGAKNIVDEGKGDIFIAKLSSKGEYVWSERFGDGAAQYVEGIAVDSGRNPIVVGSFAGTLDFPSGVISSAGSGLDPYVVKLGPDGTTQWARNAGDSGDQAAVGVAVAKDDSILATGWYEGTLDLGGGVLKNGGNVDLFVVKIDPAGNHVWSAGFGSQGDQLSTGIAATPVDGAVIAGNFTGTIVFGPDTLTAADAEDDIFVAKLGVDGTPKWARSVKAVSTQTSFGVAVDGAGNVVHVGKFHGQDVDFGGTVIDAPGPDVDVFVQKRGSLGEPVWAHRFFESDAADTDQVARAVAVDFMGRVFFTGYFTGTIAVGARSLAGGAVPTFFLARLAP